MDDSPIAHELLDVVVKLSLARSIAAVGDVVRRSARRLTGADGITFVLRDGDQCYYADEDAIAPLWKGRRFPMEACISGWVMRHREPVSIPDIYKDPRIPHGAYRPTFVKSMLMVPVRREDPIAAIGAYWAAVNKPGQHEMEIVQSLAEASALAVANVELYSELQQTIERERVARHAAEDASRLKDEFLATLSHELRTPIHVIQGWLWQLRQPNVSEATQRRGLEVLERHAALQARLVDDLLDASQGSTGTLRLDLKLVDLGEVCREVAASNAIEAAAKSVRVELALDEAPLEIVADPRRLYQAFWHVLSNAIKFSRPGGSVRLEVSRRPDGVRVQVTDDGIGIDPLFLPHAFDPFRQADGGRNRRYGGLGLGLAIVRHLTELHGGQVRAESEGPGTGATVVFDFPFGPPAVCRKDQLGLKRDSSDFTAA